LTSHARGARAVISLEADLRKHLQDETNILPLQALKAKQRWRFVNDFNSLLKNMVQQIISDAMAAWRFRKQDPDVGTIALFDSMLAALDPCLILKCEGQDRECRLKSPLDLLAFAFK